MTNPGRVFVGLALLLESQQRRSEQVSQPSSCGWEIVESSDLNSHRARQESVPSLASVPPTARSSASFFYLANVHATEECRLVEECVDALSFGGRIWPPATLAFPPLLLVN